MLFYGVTSETEFRVPRFCHYATVSSNLSFDIEAPASSVAFIADLIAGVRKVIFHFIEGIWPNIHPSNIPFVVSIYLVRFYYRFIW